MARFAMDKVNLKQIEGILHLLRQHLPELRERYKIKSLGVFGSYVRGEQKKRSDLDILVDWETISFSAWTGLESDLSKLLGVKVDLVPRQNLKPWIGKRILEEVVWLMLDGTPVPISDQQRRQERKPPMKRKREFLDFLEDIVKAMEKVERFVAGMSFDQFITDDKTISAVAREIEIIGEAVKHIPAPIRRKYPNIPWKKMAGARDRLIHGYFDVNLNVVWKIATQEIPKLKPLLVQALEKEKKKDQQG